LDPCSYELFLLRITHTIISQSLADFSWITLYIYIDSLLQTWKTITNSGIPLNNTIISTLHFACDQTVLQKSEYDFQTALYNLAQITKNYNFKISANKKTLAFRGGSPVWTKILIYNEPIGRVSHCTYLGCDVMWH